MAKVVEEIKFVKLRISKTSSIFFSFYYFFCIWVFFHEYSRLTRKAAGEGGKYILKLSLLFSPASQAVKH